MTMERQRDHTGDPRGPLLLIPYDSESFVWLDCMMSLCLLHVCQHEPSGTGFTGDCEPPRRH